MGKETDSAQSSGSQMRAGPIRVLVVDDHAIFRHGLVTVLETEPDIVVVGEARDGLEAIKKASELHPDVMVLDILMPEFSGLDALPSIRDMVPNTKVMILSISQRDEHLFQALRAGAAGFLSKDTNVKDVVHAIRKVAQGTVMLSPSCVARLVTGFRGDLDQPTMTRREMQLLQLLGEGMSNEEIAERLFISESTVRTYLRRILQKLHLKSRAEVIIYASHHHFNHMKDQATV